MFNVNSFFFEAKNPVGNSHVMMFVVELDTYVHIWNINEEPCVKMNVKGTTRQKKVTGKKRIAGLIDAANKMM